MAERRATCEVCGGGLPFGMKRCHDCRGLPTPAEIAARSAEVRAAWSDGERAKRSGCLPQHVVAAEYFDPEFHPW